MRKKILGLALVSSLLIGCHGADNKTTGAIAGGITGGLVGSLIGKGKGKVAAAAAGAIVGSVIGGNLASNVDQCDQDLASEAVQKAVHGDVGMVYTWSNSSNNHRGSAKLLGESTDAKGQLVRKVEQELIVDNQRSLTTISLSKGSDGSWYVMN